MILVVGLLLENLLISSTQSMAFFTTYFLEFFINSNVIPRFFDFKIAVVFGCQKWSTAFSNLLYVRNNYHKRDNFFSILFISLSNDTNKFWNKLAII